MDPILIYPHYIPHDERILFCGYWRQKDSKQRQHGGKKKVYAPNCPRHHNECTDTGNTIQPQSPQPIQEARGSLMKRKEARNGVMNSDPKRRHGGQTTAKRRLVRNHQIHYENASCFAPQISDNIPARAPSCAAILCAAPVP